MKSGAHELLADGLAGLFPPTDSLETEAALRTVAELVIWAHAIWRHRQEQE